MKDMEMLKISDLIKDWKGTLNVVIIVVIALLAAVILIAANKKFFKKLKKDHQNIQLTLIEKGVNIAIFLGVSIIAFSTVGGTKGVWHTLLGGTAVVSAVAAFAAQDIIKDMLAGMMIIIYKPFDIGDRIELQDGTTGVVVDMTMRHVVINTIDTIKQVIPNSKINTMYIKNYSFDSPLRSVNFNYPVAYESDVDEVREIIAETIKKSEYSMPYKVSDNGEEIYKPVYFLALTDSALIMSFTVYYNPTVPTEVVKNDINSSVKKALTDAGVEIPYQHVTLVNKAEQE